MKIGKDCIGVFVTAVLHDGAGNFLMAKRGGESRDNHGKWDFGGGTVEYGESIQMALRREMQEEFGVELFDLKQIETREFIDENGHWIGVFFVGQIDKTQVLIDESVYDESGWFTLDTLPSPMMSGDADRIAAYVAKF